MVETMKRLREPLAWFLVVCGVVQLLVALGRWFWFSVPNGQGWLAGARYAAPGALSLPLLVALIASVAACVLLAPSTPKARAIASWSSSLVWLSALLSFVLLVVAQFGSRSQGAFFIALDVMGGLVDVALKVGGALVLQKMASDLPRPTVALPAQPAEKAELAPEQAPSWSADQAIGAVWTRAGDAASGAAASTWGKTGQGSQGWQPAAQPALGQGLPPVLPVEDPAPERVTGPWATAGERARGETGASETQHDSGQGAPSWQPAPGWRAPDADQPERRD